MGGFITIDRSITEWRWFKNANVFRVFMYLLLKANFEPRDFENMTIERGQLVTSYPKLSEALGITAAQARTAIGNLKTTGEITVETTSKFSIITVINYEKYQGFNRQNDSQITGNSQANNSQSAVNQQADSSQITAREQYKQINKGTKKQITPLNPPEGGATPDGLEKKPKRQSFNAIIESYTQNGDLKTAILDFKEMRQRMRKPLTEKALRMVLKKANELGGSDEIKIKLFEQSTERGWLSLYPIKQEQLQQPRQPPQSSGNPFLEMLKEIEESEGNTVDIGGNVTGNGNS